MENIICTAAVVDPAMTTAAAARLRAAAPQSARAVRRVPGALPGAETAYAARASVRGAGP
ncbi:hypothetical protein GCM10027047_22200 [Rhodococcus aerolatus]